MTKFRDLSGLRFGRLSVVSRAQNNARGRAQWHCECDCGQSAVILGSNLIQGASLTCKCIANEIASENATERNSIHGAARRGKHTPEFRSWSAMHSRCKYPSVRDSHLYLGRGITVAPRWSLFENFLEDMGPKPTPQHSIDRFPDGGGNYEPGNCRWATAKEQAANRRAPVRREVA